MRKNFGGVLLVLVSLGPAGAQGFDAARWEKTIAAFEAKDRTTPPPKDAILFTGSSSIARWRNLGQAFPEFPVINRGFGGSTTPEVNFYVDRIVLPYKPRIVVLYSGSNDLAGKRTPEQVLSDFRVFVKKIHAVLPETKIVYISIHTPPGRLKLKEANEQVNKLISEECGKNQKLLFVDIRDLMLAQNGLPNPDLYADPLHPNARGYELWKDRLTPLFRAAYQPAPRPLKEKERRRGGAGTLARDLRPPLANSVLMAALPLRASEEIQKPTESCRPNYQRYCTPKLTPWA